MANEVRATLREVPPLIVIDLQGEVTTFADATITGAYRSACEQGAKNILINFTGVDYINSAGVAIVIGVLTEARRSDQKVSFTGLTPHYQKIFDMMGLSRYASVYPSEDAARASLGVDESSS
jgi:anti-anti-sigma factor